jgi:two-component system sensor histidine kinase KdpD
VQQAFGVPMRRRIRGFASRDLPRILAIGLPALAAATALVWLLEDRLGVLNASPVYLLAVVATALVAGTAGALLAAIGGILLYDYLFVHPTYTLEISDPGEWLNLILLLFVGLVVGQLTALERLRSRTAEAREREAHELFLVSRALATRDSTPAVLPEIARLLRRSAGMSSVWIALGGDDAAERIIALDGDSRPMGTLHWVLRRMPGDVPAQWLRIHTGGSARGRVALEGHATYRVRIEAAGRTLGSIWGTREVLHGRPDHASTRLISAAADQLGQALAQDDLAAEARAAEVARQSDALKSALLQSVSHDLRTPLATIRAAAGSLRPDSDLDEPGRAASAEAIEREVTRLDRVVANLLDLGRIEGGALRPDLDVFELDDIAGRIIDRVQPRLGGRQLLVEIGPLPVLVDPVFLDEALTNLLDNAIKFAGDGAVIRVAAGRATTASGERVLLTVEDSGPGVAGTGMERIFEPFYRGATHDPAVRPGTGIGLAVVRGMVEAMGGTARAGPSDLGGLAVTLELPLATLPAELAGRRAAVP